MSQLFDKTTSALSTALNMRLLKHNVISSNIANAETPGYHSKKMDFEQALSRALDLDGVEKMSASHGDHYSVGGEFSGRVRPDIYDDPDGVINNDGNTVNMEKEMSLMAENTYMYKAALQLINKKMAALKYSIMESR